MNQMVQSFFNATAIVYFHNHFTDKEGSRLGKEVNQAEQRGRRNLHPLRRLTKYFPQQ